MELPVPANPAAPVAGRWQPGQSGNPLGRPKGTKNHLVELQRKLEVAVREHVSAERVCRIIDKVCQMAEDGNVKAAKLILDKVISNAGNGGDEVPENGKRVVFVIQNATFAAQQKPVPVETDSAQVIEGEFTETHTSPTSTLQDHDGH